MTDLQKGAPEREEPGPTPETGPNHKALADTTTNTGNDTAMARRLRRAASWRLPELGGRSDPWWHEPPTAGYEAAAVHLLDHGLLPAPDRDGLRQMWRRGAHHRQAAVRVAQAWEFVA
jgi:hypothetical protein